MKYNKSLVIFAMNIAFAMSAMDNMDNKEISSVLLLVKTVVRLAEMNLDLTTKESNFLLKHLTDDEEFKKHIVESAKYMRTHEEFKNCQKLTITLLEATLKSNKQEATKIIDNLARHNCKRIADDADLQIHKALQK
jgi:sulfite reductase alpha subunit-like flavoprotein